MSSLFIRYIIIIVLNLLICIPGYTQHQTQVPEKFHLPAVSGEKISVSTDRTLYIVGEKIFFMIDYLTNYAIAQMEWSSVIYVELIRWNGEKIIQSKFNLDKSGYAGYLIIPEEVVSGNYYVRAYTRWMRNYGPCAYGYSRVKILNPYKEESDEGPEPVTSDTSNSINNFISKKRIDGITCNVSKSTYQQREKVELNLSLSKQVKRSPGKYVITIAEKGSIDTSLRWPVCISDTECHEKIIYYPEIRGASVSGDIINRKTRKPLANTAVYLSIPVNGKYFSTFTTNDEGRFLFTLPDLEGKFDFFIEALTDDTTDVAIRIDNDFCSLPLRLPYIPFELNPEEKELAEDMIINTQLEEKFKKKPENEQPELKSAKSGVFYGKPENVIYTGDYIELNNLEEFIYELIKPIIVYRKNGVPDIRFNIDIGLSDLSPLVLIDNLPATNIQSVLNIPVTKLERIEYFNRGYVAGDKIFKGLLSVYSKKSDFAGIEISKKGMFFNYLVYTRNNISNPVFYSEYEFPQIPDLRNTLLWQPDVSLVPGEEKTISFYTSDINGDFVVFIRGLTESGTTEMYGICSFKVE